MAKSRKITVKRIFAGVLLGVAAILVFVLASNAIIVAQGKAKIVSDEEMLSLQADCAIVLGAGITTDNEPSAMLADRLDEGARLYKTGIVSKILVSGDHGTVEHDEVNVMKDYLIEAGVPAEDIFMDHAGFSTYESVYRAQAVFGVKRLIVVTQEYHLYRALYICEQLGVQAYGAPADPREYRGAFYRNVREVIARDKDIFTCLFRVEPTCLGETIDIHGDGNVTND